MLHRTPQILLAAIVLLGASVAQAGTANDEPVPSPFHPGEAFRANQHQADQADRRRELEAAVPAAGEPLDEAHAKLALANWLASVPTAGPATRWLLDMENKADLQAITEAAREAGTQLERARAILEDDSTAEPDDPERQRQVLLQAADTLAAFVEVLQQAGVEPETQPDDRSEADAERWRKAGRGLAIARESEKPQVAAAALLWQAFALEQAGRRDRALETLPDALAKPEHLPYSLMSRLVRCRMIADTGQEPAAIVLLGRMEAQLNDWIRRNQDRDRVRRLIGLLQYQIATRWTERLEATTQPAVAEQLRPVLDGVERSFSEAENPEVYTMNTAVPPNIVPRRAEKAKNETPKTVQPDQSDAADGNQVTPE